MSHSKRGGEERCASSIEGIKTLGKVVNPEKVEAVSKLSDQRDNRAPCQGSNVLPPERSTTQTLARQFLNPFIDGNQSLPRYLPWARLLNGKKRNHFQDCPVNLHSLLPIFVMFIIAVYDIGEKRVGKMLKLFRQYLFHVQNSVFEGDLTESQLEELKKRVTSLMTPDHDSVIFYCMETNKYVSRYVLGVEKTAFGNPFL